MKALIRIAIGVASVLAVLGGMLFGLSEAGEVVVLTSVDDVGATHETRLWVLDHEGDVYLRAGDADSRWFARVRSRPLVLLERGGELRRARLDPVPGKTPEVNAAMALKYGFADLFIGSIMPRDRAVAIRVVAM